MKTRVKWGHLPLTAMSAACCLAAIISTERTAHAQGFTDITEQSGLKAVRDVRSDGWWASDLHFVDLDGDGRLDVFVSSHGSDGAIAALGDGTGKFKQATGNYPTTEIHIPYDINEDGLVDLSMTHEDGGGRWWTNASTKGALSFTGTDVTRGGNTSRIQVMLDVNQDGNVDWIRASENENGGGVIVDYGDGHGAFKQGSTQFPNIGNVNPIPVDIDGDGDKDWLTSWGDYRYEPGKTNLYREDGKLALTDVTTDSGLYVDKLATQGVGDFDNDGDSDFIAIENEKFPPSIFLNDGKGHFTKLANAITGVPGGPSYPTWGLGVVTDFDNDGIADMLFDGRNYLHALHGTGRGKFEYMNTAWGIKNFAEAAVDSGFAFGDVDQDGDLDVLSWLQADPRHLFALYRNDLPKKHWINVRAVGLAGHKGAPGAKIRVYAAGTTDLLWYEEVGIYCRQAQSGYGYHFAEEERHFGLGDRTKVDVTVEFHPSHKLVRKDGADADTTIRIGEDGDGTIVVYPPPLGTGGQGSGGTASGGSPSSGGATASGGTTASGGGTTASGGTATTGGAMSTGGRSSTATGGTTTNTGGTPGETPDSGPSAGSGNAGDDGGCNCDLTRRAPLPFASSSLLLTALFVIRYRARRRSSPTNS